MVTSAVDHPLRLRSGRSPADLTMFDWQSIGSCGPLSPFGDVDGDVKDYGDGNQCPVADVSP